MGSKKGRTEGSRGEGLLEISSATIEISTRFERPIIGLALWAGANSTETTWAHIPYFVANIENFERRLGYQLDAEQWSDIAYMVGHALKLGGVGVTYRLDEGTLLDDRVP